MSIFKQIIGAILVLVAVAGGWHAYEQFAVGREAEGPDRRNANAAGVAVELEIAELRMAQYRVEAVGTTMSRRAVEIVPLASGRLVEINFEAGQHVSAGDLLARLDNDIEQANLDEAVASLREAQLALERAQTLRQTNTVTQASLEQLISREAIARAGLERARRRLADREVRAPFDGVVGLTRVDPGARVDDSSVVATLDDRSELDIEFSLPETLYGRIAPGQPVAGSSVAFPGRRFEGGVVSIDSRIDPTGRSFKVRARIPNPEGLLPAGMFMHLTLSLDAREAVMISEEAIIPQGDEAFVFVVEGDRAIRRQVSLGQRQVGSVEIVSGLEPGERVVVRGIQRVRDGAMVRVVGEHSPPGTGANGRRSGPV